MNITKYLLVYFVVIILYTIAFYFQNSSKVTLLDSSGLGSFLSGLFAPLAFLYLYLGYRQQEKALNKTNEDILEQLKIQKEMLNLQLKDQKAKEHAAQPILAFKATADDLPYDKEIINSGTGRPIESFKRRFNFDIKNSGEQISQVNVICVHPFYKRIAFNEVINKSQPLKAYLFVDEAEIYDHFTENGLDLDIHIEYHTSLGLRYFVKYEVTTYQKDNSIPPVVMYTAKSTPTQIE
ncbi:hypothetical protein NRA53_11690 [Acinetobacter baumannii]|uniref:hypothetical protein n=1 Tax=Acinetobacter baumannii TaxID=470 RepID=UPI0023403E95|nr:hypothetical protein [Acinetobacter baumannii]MDC5001595.1 hypothetical protein [Acinetobacter baumannii]MDC5365961.1 hypothetical protein [Acinetobacter baumannii]